MYLLEEKKHIAHLSTNLTKACRAALAGMESMDTDFIPTNFAECPHCRVAVPPAAPQLRPDGGPIGEVTWAPVQGPLQLGEERYVGPT